MQENMFQRWQWEWQRYSWTNWFIYVAHVCICYYTNVDNIHYTVYQFFPSYTNTINIVKKKLWEKTKDKINLITIDKDYLHS